MIDIEKIQVYDVFINEICKNLEGRRICWIKPYSTRDRMKTKEIKVMQVRFKIFVLKDIPVEKVQAEMAAFLDQELVKDACFAELHQKNQFKGYCYDSLYPIERDKIYKKNGIYTLTVRTIAPELARYFATQAVNGYTQSVKALTAEVKVIPQKPIELLYTLTPVILKCEKKGFWRDTLSVEQYVERLKINLLKKWRQFYGEKLPEDFELFTGIEFLNKVPIKVEYKNIHLLGDKLRLYIAENETAQNLAQLAIGAGMGEMNSRGCGACNFRWL